MRYECEILKDLDARSNTFFYLKQDLIFTILLYWGIFCSDFPLTLGSVISYSFQSVLCSADMVDLFCRIWHHDWKATVYCCWLFSVTNHSYCLSTHSEGQMGKNMLMCLRKSHIMAFMCLKCMDFILEWLSCECCITKHTHSNEYLTTVLTQLRIIMGKKHCVCLCFCLCLLTTISEYFVTG